MSRPTIAEGKSCGDCGLCCKLMGVRELEKPQFVWCKQFKRGSGCRTYEARPQSCADFVCYWLHAPNLDDAWRPDRAGFLMNVAESGRRLDIEVEPATPGAWRREPYLSTLTAWAAQGRMSGLSLQIWVGRRGYELTANGVIDQGLKRPASKR